MPYIHRAVASAAVVVACFSVSPPSASAREDGVEIGLRLGYGVALGEVADGSDLSDGISGQVPIWLDLGYRINANWFVGLYGHYGIGFVGSQIGDICDAADSVVSGLADISCSASDIRFGLQAHYHIMPSESLDPWLGVGIGYEWMTFGVDGGAASTSITTEGFELLNLQFGLDYRAADHLVIGPFLSFSVGQYSNVSADCSGLAGACDGFVSGSINDKALHEWLVLGFRGAYTP